MRSFVNPKTKSVVTMHANKKLRNWESDVRHFAARAWREPPTCGAVCVRIQFFFLRPKNHYRTGKHARELREDAPQRMASKGRNDLDKLIRAVLDALTGVVYVDDGLVWKLQAHKEYSKRPGVEVWIDYE